MTHSQNKSDSNYGLLQSLSIARSLYKYAIIALLALSIIGLGWSIFGSIPQRISGIGEISSIDGLANVTTIYGGKVDKSYVKLNDTVQQGDLLFLLSQPELLDAISDLKSNINELASKDSLIKNGYNQSIGMRHGMDILGIQSIKDNIAETDKTIKFYEDKVRNEKNLYDEGLITYSQLFATQNSLAMARIEKTNLEKNLSQVGFNSQEWMFDKNVTESDIKNQLELLRLELRNLESEYKLKTEIRSPIFGKIVQIDVDAGDVIGAGEQLALVEKSIDNSQYVVNLFIPYNANSIIRKGMDVEIEPFSVDYNLYGWIRGTVIEVENYVASDYSLMKTLRNEELVGLVQKEGPVIKITVQLKTDSNTVSGFAWTNNKGTPYRISTGLLCKGHVVVKDKAPIDYLIPIFKEYFD